MGRIDKNYILSSTIEKDIEIFFCECSEGVTVIKAHQVTVAHLLADAGILPSVSEGKRNGFNIPIPQGYSELVVGKKKGRICIFNEIRRIEYETGTKI